MLAMVGEWATPRHLMLRWHRIRPYIRITGATDELPITVAEATHYR